MLQQLSESKDLSLAPHRAPAALHGLTARESQIVALIAAGASNKEIADRLAITERTVKAHLTNVFQKLGLSSRLHLAGDSRPVRGTSHPAGLVRRSNRQAIPQ